MRKKRLIGLLAVAATFLFAGCSGSVEIGPVPTITPRPAVTLAPTPTPVVGENETTDVEEVSVYETKKFKEYYEKENKLPQLKVAYDGLFEMGMDVLLIDIMDEKRAAIIKEQFNTIGIKQDFMPETIMDYETAKVSEDKTHIPLNFSSVDVILKFAQENNLSVRVPRLITEATPAWAFSSNLDRNQVVETVGEDGKTTTTVEYASAEVMTLRLENYIKDIITYCNTNYPGVVISWEVLDDPINAGETSDHKYRSHYWMKTIGENYVVQACEFARKYATPEQKLMVSQDALDEAKTLSPAMTLINMLNERNLIDGVAIQSHYSPTSPKVFDMDDMMKTLHATGLEIHYTEFNVDSNESQRADLDKTPEELLARGTKRCKALMTSLTNYEKKSGYDIKSIMFESLTNENANLNQPKEYIDYVTLEKKYGVQIESYPSMFDADLNVMSVFFAILGDVSIKAY